MVQVDAEGWASFAPTQTSGRYEATLGYGDRTVEVETYVKPQLRDWILVGLAEGTAGYNTVSGHMESLPAGRRREPLRERPGGLLRQGAGPGQVAADHGLRLGQARAGRARASSRPSTPTPTTPSTATPAPGYDAASASKLYLKIERDQFYALFGDFDTGLTVTELSRYSRSLTGLKTENATPSTSPSTPSPATPTRASSRTRSAATAPRASTTSPARTSCSTRKRSPSRSATASAAR